MEDWTGTGFGAEPAPAPPPPPAPQQQAPSWVPSSTPPVTMPAPAPAAAPARKGVSARTSAGLTMILCACGTGVGAAFGGLHGAAAGFMTAGAVRNLVRAKGALSGDEAAAGEGAKSFTIAVLGLAGAGYFIYKAYEARQADRD